MIARLNRFLQRLDALWGEILVGALVIIMVGFTLAMLSGRVHAGTIPTQLPSNVRYGGGAYSVNGTAAGGAVPSPVTTTVGGQTVTIPVSWKLGELAGIAARTAVRANAIALGTQVVLDWLLPYGIRKCEQYGWCVNSTPERAPNGRPYPASQYYSDGTKYPASTPEESCQQMATSMSSGAGTTEYRYKGVNPLNQTQIFCVFERWDKNPPVYRDTISTTYSVTKKSGCLPNHTLNSSDGMCYPPGYVPAGGNAAAADADWAKVPTATVPDTVMTAVMQQGQQWIPADPQVSTAVQTVPMSSVYKDPTTGTSYRDMGYVTPTPGNPQTANLQVIKTQVDPATGNPVTDPTTGNTTGTKVDDPCASNPNRVGCMDKGDIPASPDLLKSEKTITITPDSGWGPDTMACPADIVMPLHGGGGVVSYSFKAQCDFADGVRAPIIAIAWVAAVLIALGVGSKGGE